MKQLKYIGTSHRRILSNADLVKLGAPETAEPVDVTQRQIIITTNKVAEVLVGKLPDEFKLVGHVSDDEPLDEAQQPETVSDDKDDTAPAEKSKEPKKAR